MTLEGVTLDKLDTILEIVHLGGLFSQGEQFDSMDKFPDEKDSNEDYQGSTNPNYCVVGVVGGVNVSVASSDPVTTDPTTYSKTEPTNPPAFGNPTHGEGFTNPSYDPGAGAEQPVRVEMGGADLGDENIRTSWQVVGRVSKCCGRTCIRSTGQNSPSSLQNFGIYALNMEIQIFTSFFCL